MDITADLQSDKIKEELALASCKAAIKANDKISPVEARALLVKMLALKYPFSCPHGRPTMIKLSKAEIAAMFKRT